MGLVEKAKARISIIVCNSQLTFKDLKKKVSLETTTQQQSRILDTKYLFFK
jgi:hypothetical protein